MSDMENWKKGTVTITREEYGTIVRKEMNTVVTLAKKTGIDNQLTQLLEELLIEFSARVAASVFNDERTLEVE